MQRESLRRSAVVLVSLALLGTSALLAGIGGPAAYARLADAVTTRLYGHRDVAPAHVRAEPARSGLACLTQPAPFARVGAPVAPFAPFGDLDAWALTASSGSAVSLSLADAVDARMIRIVGAGRHESFSARAEVSALALHVSYAVFDLSPSMVTELRVEVHLANEGPDSLAAVFLRGTSGSTSDHYRRRVLGQQAWANAVLPRTSGVASGWAALLGDAQRQGAGLFFHTGLYAGHGARTADPSAVAVAASWEDGAFDVGNSWGATSQLLAWAGPAPPGATDAGMSSLCQAVVTGPSGPTRADALPAAGAPNSRLSLLTRLRTTLADGRTWWPLGALSPAICLSFCLIFWVREPRHWRGIAGYFVLLHGMLLVSAAARTALGTGELPWLRLWLELVVVVLGWYAVDELFVLAPERREIRALRTVTACVLVLGAIAVPFAFAIVALMDCLGLRVMGVNREWVATGISFVSCAVAVAKFATDRKAAPAGEPSPRVTVADPVAVPAIVAAAERDLAARIRH